MSLTRLALAGLIAAGLAACDAPEPVVSDAQPMFRRLTEAQYRNIVEDVFGPQIAVAGSFDPILRTEGLVASSAAETTISASALEKFEKLAQGIAGQVVDPVNRKLLVGCTPARADADDDACARSFVLAAGRYLFRRPLTDAEAARITAIASEAARQTGDFYQGLQFGMVALLTSPHFLFVVDSFAPGTAQLSPYAKATRLSFFLWNAGPDAALMDAAARGELDTARGVETQVKRLIESPRFDRGVRALFSDMLEGEKFGQLVKDQVIYPGFDTAVIDDSREQLLRTITYHLLERDADYRTLFDTRATFMTAALGRAYRVPVSNLEGWSPYEFPAGSGRAGIQTLTGFLALHAQPGRSSPTVRGRAVRELLLCQRVPDPPSDIDFSLFNAPTSTELPARKRLQVHNSVPSCAGCHKLTDPIGLALENFDGAGQFRTVDFGESIDIAGDLDGIAFTTTEGLATALRDHPALPACLVRRTVAYALSGVVHGPQAAWEQHLLKGFAESGYRLKPLLRAIALSPNFLAARPVKAGASAETPS